jgi:hypothetical protein
MEPLIRQLTSEDAVLKETRRALEGLLEIDPDNRRLLAGRAFFHAMEGEEQWGNALEAAERFLRLPGRESHTRLKTGLLHAQLFALDGRSEETRQRLQAFRNETRDPWYRSIADCLLGTRGVASLLEEASLNPENLITAHTALGLQAEGRGDRAKALGYYMEALGSYIDYWLEYDLAVQRIQRLRGREGA